MNTIKEIITDTLSKSNLQLSTNEKEQFIEELLIFFDCYFDNYVSKSMVVCRTDDVFKDSDHITIGYNCIGKIVHQISKHEFTVSHKNVELIAACTHSMFRMMKPDPILFDGIMFFFHGRNAVYLKNPEEDSKQLIYLDITKVRSLIHQDIVTHIESRRPTFGAVKDAVQGLIGVAIAATIIMLTAYISY